MKSKVALLIILLFAAVSQAKVFEDSSGTGVSFYFMNQVDLAVNGNVATGKVFFTNNTVKEAEAFYRKSFLTEGFKENRASSLGDDGLCLMFSKGKKIQSVQIFKEQKGCLCVRYESEKSEKEETSGDKPGRDLKDVYRPGGSVRELTMERLNGKEKSITIIYKCGASESFLKKACLNEMQDKGWSYLPDNNEGRMSEVLVFQSLNKWCTVSIKDGYYTVIYYYKD